MLTCIIGMASIEHVILQPIVANFVSCLFVKNAQPYAGVIVLSSQLKCTRQIDNEKFL